MIPYVAPKYNNIQRVGSLLKISSRTNHFTNNGPVKELLENELARRLELSHDKKVVCFSNGTSALHGLLYLCQAYKWACPSFTFPSAMVGGVTKVTPLDIHPGTATLPMEKDLLEEFDGIILTTLFGGYLDIPSWERFCQETGKYLILDNASSPLSNYCGNICNRGDYSFGSLHHTKYLGVGEGGFAVVPENEYNDLLAITNFGFKDNRQYHPGSSNFKMSDISAAHILAHLEKYDVQAHAEIQKEIIQETESESVKFLNNHPGVIFGNLPITFPHRAQAENTYFQSMNIVANKYYKPLKNTPESYKLYNKIVNLPLYDSLGVKDVKNIIKAIKTYSELK